MFYVGQTPQTTFNNYVNSSCSYGACPVPRSQAPFGLLYDYYLPAFSHLPWGWVRFSNLPKVLGFELSRLSDSKAHCSASHRKLVQLIVLPPNARFSSKLDLSFYSSFQHLRNYTHRVLRSSFQISVVISATVFQINDSAHGSLSENPFWVDITWGQWGPGFPSAFKQPTFEFSAPFPMCPKVIMRQTVRDYIGLRRVMYEACLHCSRLTTNMLRNNAEGVSFVVCIFTIKIFPEINIMFTFTSCEKVSCCLDCRLHYPLSSYIIHPFISTLAVFLPPQSKKAFYLSSFSFSPNIK